jgi:hypothetical protein
MVTIIGTNLANATVVYFGFTKVTAFSNHTDTSISIITPPFPSSGGAIPIFDVQVGTPGGTSAVNNPADQFAYLFPILPAVTAVSPTSGPSAGGTTVIITGTNFTGASAVAFGNTLATSFKVVSDTQITVTTPSEPASIVDVTVKTDGGTSATSASDKYAFTATPTPTPIIISTPTPTALPTPTATPTPTLTPTPTPTATPVGALVVSAPRQLTARHGSVALSSIHISVPSSSGKALLQVHVSTTRGAFRSHAAHGKSAAHTVSSVTLTGNAATVNRALNSLVLVLGGQKAGKVTIAASAGNLTGHASIKIVS